MAFFGIASFCDDVRREISGKVSLIGLYGSHMYVSEFPLRLPKLCIIISLVFEEESEIDKDLTIKVIYGDKVIHKMTFNELFSQLSTPCLTGFRANAIIEFPFFKVVKQSSLSVLFESSDLTTNVGTLFIKKEKK